ncbi:MAG: acyl-CoA dehydrogenase family protein [Alphaproteobacteria bacterium]|jgi:cyclohexanecarboxyl-CoA dehydrogenase|nr:acyl-CoA dehydrogenase family protein [Alphaproteobacteria bacterium]
MDFAFTEEQEAIRETARRFATERLAPGYQEREADGVLPMDLIEEMGSLGLIGVDIPEEFGGLGLGRMECGIVAEEISSADLSLCYIILNASLLGSMLATHATPDLTRQALARVCKGQTGMALGLTEPRGGSDAAGLILKARREGNDRYILNGEKTSISLANQSDEIVVLARTGEVEDRARSVTAFLVPLDAPGISVTTFDDLGSKTVGRSSVFFDDVEVPMERRIGDENEGFRQIMNGFDYSRAIIGLQVLGPAQKSLDETWDYITQREAFGTPIAKFQGVTEPLATAETQIAAARLLCYKTLWLRDQNLRHTSEAAMCKWWAPKLAFEVIHRCLITHGHFGYSVDLPHQQRMRDVLGLQIGDGTEQIMKMIISRERIGRIAVPYD